MVDKDHASADNEWTTVEQGNNESSLDFSSISPITTFVFSQDNVSCQGPSSNRHVDQIQTKNVYFIYSQIFKLTCFIEQDRSKRIKLFSAILDLVNKSHGFSTNLYNMHLSETSDLRNLYDVCFNDAAFFNSPFQIFNFDRQRLLTSPTVDNCFTLHQNFCYIWDRYNLEFRELSVLGCGGFGIVVKALHLLDDCEYAIKKIPIGKKSYNEALKLLREVHALALIDHPNIVRYYSAWVQRHRISREQIQEALNDSLQESTGSRNSAASSNISCDKQLLKELDRFQIINLDRFSSSSSDVIFENSNSYCCGEEEPKNKACGISNIKVIGAHGHFNSSVELSRSIKKKRRHKRCKQYDVSKETSELAPFSYTADNSHFSKFPMFIFIQMKLYGCSLKQWLEARMSRVTSDPFAEVDYTFCFKIFKDIIEAVQYIHSKHIIHRDIKPGNILFSMDKCRALLCDFGLSWFNTWHGSENFNSLFSLENSSLTKDIGTAMYASPEMLRGKSYNYKTDMYSLGIILIELLYPFKTMQEKEKILLEMKKKRLLSTDFMNKWPQASTLALSLTEKSPYLRPAASEVFKFLTDLETSDRTNIFMESDDSSSSTSDILHSAHCTVNTPCAMVHQKLKEENKQLTKRIVDLENEVQQLKLKK